MMSRKRCWRGGIQSVHGLVEEEDGGAGGDGAGEESAPALASGKLADAALSQVDQAHGGQSLGGGLAVGPAVRAEQAALGREAHHGHVPDGDGKVPVHLLQLGHESDVLAHLGAGPALDEDLAGIELDEADHGLEQGRLAAAVGSHHSGQAAAFDGEGHAVQGQDRTVTDADLLEADHLGSGAGVGVGLAVPGVGVAVLGVGVGVARRCVDMVVFDVGRPRVTVCRRLSHDARRGTSRRRREARGFRRREPGTAG